MENEEAWAGGLQLVKVEAVGKNMTVHAELEETVVTVEAVRCESWGDGGETLGRTNEWKSVGV